MKLEYVAICDICGAEEQGHSKDENARKDDNAKSYFERKGWSSHKNEAFCVKCSTRQF